MSQTQFLPSLLADALNSGKRPGQREKRPATRSHSRQHSSKSRETSLTPGLFSSPNVPIEMSDEDGPPRERSELSVFISERSQSPTRKENSKLLNTPSSVDNTVTVYGFPTSKRDFVLELLYSYGSVTSAKKSEKLDGNWVLITYLTRHSADRALLLDGQLMEDGWVLAARRGDFMNIMSPKKSFAGSVPRTGQSSLGIMEDDHPPDQRLWQSPPKPKVGGMTSAFRPSPKSLVLDDSFLDTPSKPQSTSRVESPLLYYSERVKVLHTPEMTQIGAEQNFRFQMDKIQAHQEKNRVERHQQQEPDQMPSVLDANPSEDVTFYGTPLVSEPKVGFEGPAVAKAGILTRVADLLFGW
jgi:hypothetical protein